MHHNPCFNLFLLHDNSFDTQGSKINKKHFFTFQHTVFYENFLPSIYIYIHTHIYREREKETYRYTHHTYVYVYVHACIFAYIFCMLLC